MSNGSPNSLMVGSQAFAILLVFTGVLLQRSNFRTARPPAPPTVEAAPGQEEIFARLWDDPLKDWTQIETKERITRLSLKKWGDKSEVENSETFERPQESLAPEAEEGKQVETAKLKGLDIKSEKDDNYFDFYLEFLRKIFAGKTQIEETRQEGLDIWKEACIAADDKLKKENPNRNFRASNTLLLWNVIDTSPFPEFRERRLRTRYAITTSLLASGYLPARGATLDEVKGEFTTVDKNDSPFFRIAFIEYFKRRTPSQNSKISDLPEWVIVAWHPSNFGVGRFANPYDSPTELAQLFDKRASLICALPNNVASLPAFANLPKNDSLRFGYILNHGNSNDLKNYLTSNISTNNDNEKMEERGKKEFQVLFTRATLPYSLLNAPRKSIEEANSLNMRAIVTDDRTIESLIKELKERIPALRLNIKNSDQQKTILILTEADTAYGSQLAKIARDELADSGTKIKICTYLRGLDGLQEYRDEAEPKQTNPSNPMLAGMLESGLSEKAWGTSQFDYLRRMALSLRDEQGEEVVAIGVLGSDIYDKLLVLQALRPEFPDVLYFTTDLDSLYLRQEHLPFTRNLLVGSASGLDVASEMDLRIPSMRDSYQANLGILVQKILHNWKKDEGGGEVLDEKSTPPVWEVGTGKFVRLAAIERDPGSNQNIWNTHLIKIAGDQWYYWFIPCLINAYIVLAVLLFRSPRRKFRWWRRLGLGVLLLQISLMSVTLGLVGGSIFRVTIGTSDILHNLVLFLGVVGVFPLLWSKPWWPHLSSGKFNWKLLFARIRIVTLLSAPFMFAFLSKADKSWLAPVILLALTGTSIMVGRRILKAREQAEDIKKNLVPNKETEHLSIKKFNRSEHCFFLALGLMALAWALNPYHVSTDRSLLGEPLNLTDGAGIWPSILLRTIAYGTALLLLFRTCRISRRTVDDLHELKEKPNGIFLHLLKQPDSETNTTGKKVESAGEFLERLLCPNRAFLSIVSISSLAFLTVALLYSIWPPFAPGRGLWVLIIEKLSGTLGLSLFVVHLTTSIVLHRKCGALMQRINIGFDKLELGENLSGLGETKEFLADLTSSVGRTLLYPLAVLSLMVLSKLRVFDNWSMSPSSILIILISLVVLASVATSSLLQGQLLASNFAKRARQERKKLEELRRQIRRKGNLNTSDLEALMPQSGKNEIKSAKKRIETADLEAQMKELSEDLREVEMVNSGAFGPWYKQPVFIAIIAGLAVFGSVEVVEPAVSLFVR